jgi:hypothetical protein
MSHIPISLRNQVKQLARGFCEYCKAPQVLIMTLEIDHIQPESLGGATVLENLCCACRVCNGRKQSFQTGIDPITGEEVALFNPRQQNWQEHFYWHEDFTEIGGITSIGRATIQRLKLNHPLMKNAREGWRKAGWQPPS